MSDVFGELRSEIRSAGLDHTLSPTERHVKLSALRAPLVDALGELDRYRADGQALREADAAGQVTEVLWLRQNATIRDEILEAGDLSAEQLDEFGMLSHEELDRLDEEGLLEEAAASIAQRYAEQRKPPVTEQPPPPRPAPTPEPGEPDPEMAAADERAVGALTDHVGTKSEQAERSATPVVQQTVEQEGGTVQGLDQRLKPRASIRAKLKRRRDTMPLASDDERASSITDGARYTAVFPDASYNQGVERTIGALAQKGFKQQEFQNWWGDDIARGALGVFRAPNGSLVEIRLHTQASAALEQRNAPIIAKFRTEQDPHERWDLWQEMAANAAKVPPPKGAGEVGQTQQAPGPSVDAASGLPTTGPDSFHSHVAPHELQPGDRAQDPLHGGAVTAAGPAKTVASVDGSDGESPTTVSWHDGSASTFQPGSTVKKLRGGK